MQFIDGKFGNKAIRLGSNNLFVPSNLGNDYAILLYRKLSADSTWDKVFVLSNGDTYVNDTLDGSYDTSWLSIDTNGDITISSTAEDIDELLVLNRLPTSTELEEWNNIDRPFYDVINEYGYDVPSAPSMQVL